jgi:hypothetical protein
VPSTTAILPRADKRIDVRARSGVAWTFWLAASILVFNLIDGILTLAVVDLGLATEANPLMDATLQWGGVPFMLVKTSLVSLGVYLLYRRRERPLAAGALFGLSAVYAALVAYHVNSVEALVRLAA